MPFSISHLLTGAAQGGAGALRGKQEAEDRARQDRLDLLQEQLLNFRMQQDTANQARQERGDLYDEMMGRARLQAERGEARRRAGEAKRKRGTDAATAGRLEYEAETRRINATRPRAPSVAGQRAAESRQYEDAVGRAMIALRANQGDEAVALKFLAKAYPVEDINAAMEWHEYPHRLGEPAGE